VRSMSLAEKDITATSKLSAIATRWGKKGGARQYSEEEIGTALAVLDYYSGNALRTARVLGIPRTTILRWLDKGENLPPHAVAVRQRKREEFAALSDEASEWIITSITPKDIRTASLYQKVTSYAILRDKAALDSGQPTQVVEHRHKIEDARGTYAKLISIDVPREEAISEVVKAYELSPDDVKLLSE
jgi:hypothetical protein